MTKPEMVNHPAHYGRADDPYEVIKVIEAWKLNFCLGTAVKYIPRAGKKSPETLIEDLQKAAWYLNREIQRLKAEQPEEELLAELAPGQHPYVNCHGPCDRLLPMSELSNGLLCRSCFDPNIGSKKRKKPLRGPRAPNDRKKPKRRAERQRHWSRRSYTRAEVRRRRHRAASRSKR